MTHHPALPSPSGHPRCRRPVARLACVAAVVCGVALLGVLPASAGTALHGKVTFQAMASAKPPEGRDAAPAYSDLVVYVTEKPGGAPLAGRATRRDITLNDDRFGPREHAIYWGA